MIKHHTKAAFRRLNRLMGFALKEAINPFTDTRMQSLFLSEIEELKGVDSRTADYFSRAYSDTLDRTHSERTKPILRGLDGVMYSMFDLDVAEREGTWN